MGRTGLDWVDWSQGDVALLPPLQAASRAAAPQTDTPTQLSLTSRTFAFSPAASKPTPAPALLPSPIPPNSAPPANFSTCNPAQSPPRIPRRLFTFHQNHPHRHANPSKSRDRRHFEITSYILMPILSIVVLQSFSRMTRLAFVLASCRGPPAAIPVQRSSTPSKMSRFFVKSTSSSSSMMMPEPLLRPESRRMRNR